jgi:hypothetical protein
MQSSRNNIHMLCSSQTHEHIDMFGMKYNINHSMQSSCNGMHMFCYIQNHIHDVVVSVSIIK